MDRLIDYNAFGTFFSVHLDAIDISCLKLTCSRYKTYFDKLYPPLKSYDKAKRIRILAMKKGYWKIVKYFVSPNDIRIFNKLDNEYSIALFSVYKSDDIDAYKEMLKSLFPKQSFGFELALKTGSSLLISSTLKDPCYIKNESDCIRRAIELENLEALEHLRKILYYRWPICINDSHKSKIFQCENVKIVEWFVENKVTFEEYHIPNNYSKPMSAFIEKNAPNWFEQRIAKRNYFENDEETMLKFSHLLELHYLFDHALEANHFKILTKIITERKPIEYTTMYSYSILDLSVEWIKRLNSWKPLSLSRSIFEDINEMNIEFEKLKFLYDEKVITYEQFLTKVLKPDQRLSKDLDFQKFILSQETIEEFDIIHCDNNFILLFIEKFPECLITFNWDLIHDPRLIQKLMDHKNKNHQGTIQDLFLQFESLDICLSILPKLTCHIDFDITYEIKKGKTWIFELLRHPLMKKQKLRINGNYLYRILPRLHFYETLKALENFYYEELCIVHEHKCLK